jgi:hypothetical protein
MQINNLVSSRVLSQAKSLVPIGSSQQCVHLTLGILRTFQAFFCALAFFWLDGFAVPAPAQVTQTVGRWLRKQKFAFRYME